MWSGDDNQTVFQSEVRECSTTNYLTKYNPHSSINHLDEVLLLAPVT